MAPYEYTPKVCPHCGHTFPSTAQYFYRDATRTDGLHPYCKTCVGLGARQRARRSKHRHKTAILQRQRERRQANIATTRAQSRDYYAKNNDIFARAWQKWSHKNKDILHAKATTTRLQKNANYQTYRSRKYRLPVQCTAHDWQFALQYWRHSCAVCGTQESLIHRIAMDHWIPLSDIASPGHVAWNIVPLCHGTMGCKNRKSKRDPLEWLMAQYGREQADEKMKVIVAFFGIVRQRKALHE